jgi:squalene synthase HpnC
VLSRQVALPPPAIGTAELRGLRRAENFSVASAWIPRRERRLLLAVYAYARLVDEVGDGGRDDASAVLDAIEHDVHAGAGGDLQVPALRPVLARLERGGLPREPLLDLIEANRRDQVVSRYETFGDLIGYCRLSADPVGRLVLEVMGASSAVTRPLSDAICSGLQVVEHLQDVGEDARRGRIYLPAADLAAEDVSAGELDAASAGPGLRRVIALQSARARALLVTGSPLAGMLRGWKRVAVAGYVAGGLAAVAALADADFDVLGRRPRAGRAARAALTARVAVRGRAR